MPYLGELKSFPARFYFKIKLFSNVDQFLKWKIIKKETPVHYISIVLHYIIVNVNISHTSLYAMYDITVFNSSNNAVNNKFVNIHILFYCTTISYVIVLLYDNLHTINQENKRHFSHFKFFVIFPKFSVYKKYKEYHRCNSSSNLFSWYQSGDGLDDDGSPLVL